MKKIFLLLLVALICISLAACTSDNAKSDTNENDKIETNEKNKFEREMTEDGHVVVSKKEFASYITKVALTTENWKDYLDIVERTEEERNGFGEVVYSTTSTECTAKNVMACYFDDVSIDFKIIENGESVYCEGIFHSLKVPNDYQFSWENYTIDDFTCEKIVGDLIIFDNFPDECLSTYEDGGKFICVGSADDYMTMDINDKKDMSMNISLAYAIYK